jgi:hypothetical protein
MLAGAHQEVEVELSFATAGDAVAEPARLCTCRARERINVRVGAFAVEKRRRTCVHDRLGFAMITTVLVRERKQIGNSPLHRWDGLLHAHTSEQVGCFGIVE